MLLEYKHLYFVICLIIFVGHTLPFYISHMLLLFVLQASRYAVILGPMLWGSFAASVVVYNLVRTSTDLVKLFAFGALTLAVILIASGLAAGSFGRSPGTACYSRFATLAAVSISLSLFTCAFCSLFSLAVYKIACAAVFGIFIVLLVIVWLADGW